MTDVSSGLSLKVENKAIGETFRIIPVGTLLLGSEVGCEINVQGDGVAPKHGAFVLKEGLLSFVAEATSTVNEKEVVKGSSVLLEIGDVIKIGPCLITVEKTNVEEKPENVGISEVKPPPKAENIPEYSSSQITICKGTDELLKLAAMCEMSKKTVNPATPVETFGKDVLDMSKAALKKFDNSMKVAGKSSTKTVFTKNVKSGFFKGLLGFSPPTKKLSGISLPISKKKTAYRIPDLAGPLPRFWAMLWDGIFVYLFSAYVFPLSGWKTLSAIVVNFFNVIVGPTLLPVIVEKIWPIVLLFIVYRIICAALFGVSFSQLVLLMHGSSDTFGNRFRGVFRELIGALTFPFLVFDLPCVFGKRTFKEIVSKVSLRSSQSGLALFTGVVVLPLLVSMVSIVSLFGDEHASFRTPIEERDVAEERKFDKDFDDLMGTKQIPFNSSWFKMKGLLYAESNFVFMPSWQINKNEDKNLIRPVLMAFDNKRGLELELSVSRLIDLKDAVKISSEKNYLFPLSFKTLANSMKEEGALTPFAATELEELANASMGLSFTHLPQHLLAYGPFVDGFVSFRKWVIQAAGIKKLSRVEFFTLGKQRFMVLYEADPGYEYDEKLEMRIVLMPLVGGTVPVYEITLPFMKMARVTWQRFIPEFFKEIRFSFGEQKTEEETGKNENLTVFSVLDRYTDKELPESKRRALNDYIHDYFRNIGKFVLQVKSDALEQRLLETLDRYDAVDKIASISNFALTDKLKHLSAAIKDRNFSYFGIK